MSGDFRCVLGLAALLAWSGCAGAGSADAPATAGAPRARRWDLGADLAAVLVDGDATAPSAATAAAGGDWSLLATTRSSGAIEARVWERDGRYRPLAPDGGAPAIAAAGRASDGALVRPGADAAAIIGWRAPASGALVVSGSFEHIGANGGRASWYVERGATPDPIAGFVPRTLSRGTMAAGSPTQRAVVYLAGVEVHAGDWLYFIVDAHADGTAAPEEGDRVLCRIVLTMR